MADPSDLAEELKRELEAEIRDIVDAIRTLDPSKLRVKGAKVGPYFKEVYEALNELLSTVKTRFAACSRIDDLDRVLEQCQNDLADIQDALGAVSGAGRVTSKVKDLTRQIEEHRQRIQALEQQNIQLQEEKAQLAREKDQLAQERAQDKRSIQELTTAASSFDARITELQVREQELKTRSQDLARMLEQCEQGSRQHSELERRLERVQRELEACQKELRTAKWKYLDECKQATSPYGVSLSSYFDIEQIKSAIRIILDDNRTDDERANARVKLDHLSQFSIPSLQSVRETILRVYASKHEASDGELSSISFYNYIAAILDNNDGSVYPKITLTEICRLYDSLLGGNALETRLKTIYAIPSVLNTRINNLIKVLKPIHEGQSRTILASIDESVRDYEDQLTRVLNTVDTIRNQERDIRRAMEAETEVQRQERERQQQWKLTQLATSMASSMMSRGSAPVAARPGEIEEMSKMLQAAKLDLEVALVDLSGFAFGNAYYEIPEEMKKFTIKDRVAFKKLVEISTNLLSIFQDERPDLSYEENLFRAKVLANTLKTSLANLAQPTEEHKRRYEQLLQGLTEYEKWVKGQEPDDTFELQNASVKAELYAQAETKIRENLIERERINGEISLEERRAGEIFENLKNAFAVNNLKELERLRKDQDENKGNLKALKAQLKLLEDPFCSNLDIDAIIKKRLETDAAKAKAEAEQAEKARKDALQAKYNAEEAEYIGDIKSAGRDPKKIAEANEKHERKLAIIDAEAAGNEKMLLEQDATRREIYAQAKADYKAEQEAKKADEAQKAIDDKKVKEDQIEKAYQDEVANAAKERDPITRAQRLTDAVNARTLALEKLNDPEAVQRREREEEVERLVAQRIDQEIQRRQELANQERRRQAEEGEKGPDPLKLLEQKEIDDAYTDDDRDAIREKYEIILKYYKRDLSARDLVNLFEEAEEYDQGSYVHDMAELKEYRKKEREAREAKDLEAQEALEAQKAKLEQERAAAEQALQEEKRKITEREARQKEEFEAFQRAKQQALEGYEAKMRYEEEEAKKLLTQAVKAGIKPEELVQSLTSTRRQGAGWGPRRVQ